MKKEHTSLYRCPIDKDTLAYVNEGEREYLKSTSDKIYEIIDGIPDFTLLESKHLERNKYAIDLFKEKARLYDKYQHLSFETFYKKEDDVRNHMIDKLDLSSNSIALEVNCGTGRDSKLIAKRLGGEGELHIQDISREMLEVCQEKINKEKYEVPIYIHQGNALKLPYEQKMFDSVYSFGGIGMNTYLDNKSAIKELVRVTKVGGKIVFGGLSLAPWLQETTFGEVLVNHNSHYANKIIFEDFPIEARELKVEWILNGAGFVIEFIVGEGEPKGNFTYEIPGHRGGTHMTRMYGKLEGVTPETKELALKAREKLGVSMHQWLDEVIRVEANKILKEDS